MGFGILEDHRLQHVPGTVVLDEEAAHLISGLKHATGRNVRIVLAPQPSEDPNDPLNWPVWRRELCFGILCIGGVLVACVISPMLNTSIVILAGYFNEPIPSVVLVTGGYILLVTGTSGPFYCALSRKYGKRPIFLFSTLIAIIGTAIGEASTTFNMLLACRIVQGFSISAFESLLVASVGDLFFVHQRGFRVSVVNFMINVTAQLYLLPRMSANVSCTLISGQIANNLGWQWLFHILQMFLVPLLIMIFLFCPETTYIRERLYETDVVQDEHLAELAELEKTARGNTTEELEQVNVSSSNPARQRKSTLQLLAIYNGSFTNYNLLKLFAAPFVTLLNIGALYTVITSGILQAWYVGTAIIQTQLFAAPPYLLNAAQIGYLSVGPLLGGTIGSFLIAFISDPIAKWASNRNKGIYEPEFRLLPIPLGMTVFTSGMIGYGWAVQHGTNVYVCCVLNGMMLGGGLMCSSAVIVYALDSYRDSSNEIFIMNMVFKNFIYYALSNFVSSWATNQGPGEVMSVFGGTGFFLCALASPVYIFGKRLRSFWTRHNLLVKWHLNSTNAPEMLA